MKDNLFLTEPKKRDFYSNNINENKSDSAKLWKSLKSVISNTKNTTNIGCLESEFGIVCKQIEIAQSFAKNFQTAVMKIRNNLLGRILSTKKPLRKQVLFPPHGEYFSTSKINRLCCVKFKFTCCNVHKPAVL